MLEWDLDLIDLLRYAHQDSLGSSDVSCDYETQLRNYARGVLRLYEENETLFEAVRANDKLWSEIADRAKDLTQAKPMQDPDLPGAKIRQESSTYIVHGIYHGGLTSRLSTSAKRTLREEIKHIFEGGEILLSEDNLLAMLGYSSELEMGDHRVAERVVEPFYLECSILSSMEYVLAGICRRMTKYIFRQENPSYKNTMDSLTQLEDRINQDYLGYLLALRSIEKLPLDISMIRSSFDYIQYFQEVVRSAYMAWFLQQLCVQIQTQLITPLPTIHALVGMGHEDEIASCLRDPSLTPAKLLVRQLKRSAHYV